MGFFKKTEEEIAIRDARKLEEAKRKEEEEQKLEEQWQLKAELATPAGQAKTARNAGARTFQISLPLSETTGNAGLLWGASAQTTATQHSSIIDSIESQGWKLEHADYVYQFTKSVSSTHVFAGLQQGAEQAFYGEIIGIYIFRISEK